MAAMRRLPKQLDGLLGRLTAWRRAASWLSEEAAGAAQILTCGSRVAALVLFIRARGFAAPRATKPVSLARYEGGAEREVAQPSG